MSDAPLTDCPVCEGEVRRVVSSVGVVFKGSGFYVTDNRGKAKSSTATAKRDDGSESGNGSSESGNGSSANSTGDSEKSTTPTETPAKKSEKAAAAATS
jgi:hypothetical protein